MPAVAVGTHVNKPNNTQRQERQGPMRLNLTTKLQCPADFGVPRVLAMNRHHSQFPARAIPTANPKISNAIAPSSNRHAPGRCICPSKRRAPNANAKKEKQADTAFVYRISAVPLTNPNRALRDVGCSSIYQQSIKEKWPSRQHQPVVNPAHTRGLRRIRFLQGVPILERGQEVTQ